MSEQQPMSNETPGIIHIRFSKRVAEHLVLGVVEADIEPMLREQVKDFGEQNIELRRKCRSLGDQLRNAEAENKQLHAFAEMVAEDGSAFSGAARSVLGRDACR